MSYYFWPNYGTYGAKAVYALVEGTDGTIYAGVQTVGRSWENPGRIYYADVYIITDGETYTTSMRIKPRTNEYREPEYSVTSLAKNGETLYIGTDSYYNYNNWYNNWQFRSVIYRTSDGGESHEITNDVYPSDIDQPYYVRSLLVAGELLYAGLEMPGLPDYPIYYSGDDGTTWFATNELAGATRVDALLEASDGTIYAGTGPNGVVFKTTDLGVTWTDTGSLSGATVVLSLLETSDGMIYAGTNAEPSPVFKSPDGGMTWIETGEFDAHVYSLVEVNNAIYAATRGSSLTPVFITTNGGATWTTIGEISETSPEINTLLVTSDGVVYAGAKESFEEYGNTRWKGVVYRQCNRNECGIGDRCVSHGSVNPDDLCMVCDVTQSRTDWSAVSDDTACEDGDNLFCTLWTCQAGICQLTPGNPCPGGTTCDEAHDWCPEEDVWVQTAATPSMYTVYDLLEAPGGAIYAATDCDNFPVYKTTDGGMTWTQTGEIPGGDKVSDLLRATDGTGRIYALANVGSDAIFSTTDGGTTWVQASDIGEVDYISSLVASADGTTIYAGVYEEWFDENGNKIISLVYTTTDSGASWTRSKNHYRSNGAPELLVLEHYVR